MVNFNDSVKQAYRAAKNSAVIIDNSGIGQLQISGADHVDLLHRMTTNEIRNLQPGQSLYNVFTNEKGRIIDRVLFLKKDDGMRLLTSPGNTEKIHQWIEKFTFIEDVRWQILSEFRALAVYGPKAAETLSGVLKVRSENLNVGSFTETDWQNDLILIIGIEDLTVPGFLILVKSGTQKDLWDLLIQKGIQPMGEDVYNILRIEGGWPLYGKDFDDTINPHEAGMLPYINFDKGCYIGQEVVARLDTYEKVQKHLMGFILEGNTPAPKDRVSINDDEVGYLTSVAYSFDLGKNIALGYVKTKAIRDNMQIAIKSKDSLINGKMVKLPFKTQA